MTTETPLDIVVAEQADNPVQAIVDAAPTAAALTTNTVWCKALRAAVHATYPDEAWPHWDRIDALAQAKRDAQSA